MANFDRSQFKAAKVSDLKKLKEEEDKNLSSGGDKKEFINIEKGSNKIRFAPKFPGEKDFYLMRMVHWGSIENNDGDLKRLPILNSKIHGGTKKDIFEEYISFAKKELASQPEKIKALTDWKGGISSSVSWWAYGWKLVKGEDPKFGIFEMKRSVRDALNSLTIIEDEDEAIEVDPFTDPDEGRSVIIKYDPDSKDKNKKYTVQLSSNASPLTDEMFEELCSKQPLTELMRDCYTITDFEKALEALRNYDIEHELELFDEKEFQATIKEVKSQYSSAKGSEKPKSNKKVVDDNDDEDEEDAPVAKKKPAAKPVVQDDDDDEDEVKPAKKTASKKVEVEEDEEEEVPAPKVIKDKFSKMDREELKEYIGENDLDVKVKKSESDEDIRNNIRTAESAVEEVEEDEEEEEEKEEVVETKKPAAKTETVDKPKMSLQELREKLQADKNKKKA